MKQILTKKGIIGSIKYSQDENGDKEILEIICGKTDNGECFKGDWDCGGVIYVSEYGALDFSNRKDNGVSFEDCAWTKESWIDWVKEELRWESEDTAIWTDDKFVEYIAKYIFDDVEWEDLSTRFSEWINGNDIIDEYRRWKKGQGTK